MTSPKSAATGIQEEASASSVIAWLLCLVFVFLTYMLRSVPGVMVPELSAAFGFTALGVSSLLGLYYYALAECSDEATPRSQRRGVHPSITVAFFADF